MEKALPAIPAKRYFTIGEVSELCGVKPYVLRYWEQEFTQLKPMKRRGNRRYYQHHEVLLIRRIRDLLYDQGFTISGARNRLADAQGNGRNAALNALAMAELDAAAAGGAGPSTGLADADVEAFDALMSGTEGIDGAQDAAAAATDDAGAAQPEWRSAHLSPQGLAQFKKELLSIRDLLSV